MSSDPQYEEKKNRVLQLYNNPPEGDIVVSLDEKGSITVKEYGGSAWRVDEARIPDRQQVKGKVEFSAAYLPHAGKILHRFTDRKNSHEVIELVKKVRSEYPDKGLHLILDNHRIHTSKEFKDYVKEDGSIELAYTPKHASWLNAVEQIFASIQRWVINNSSYQSVEEATRMIEKHLNTLSQRLIALLSEKPYTFALRMVQMINPMPT